MGSNPAALKLYNKLGFVEEGRLKKNFSLMVNILMIAFSPSI